MRERYRSRAGDYRPEPWRDVLAAYLVYRGLALASHTGKLRMMHAVADEWRFLVGQAMRAHKTDQPDAVADAADRAAQAARELLRDDR